MSKKITGYMKQKIEDALKLCGYFSYDVDGEYITFSEGSPAGQDFSIEIEIPELHGKQFKRQFDELAEAVYEYWQGYDPDEEASLWTDGFGHGTGGAPYNLKDLVEDMEWCKERIYDLYQALTGNEAYFAAAEGEDFIDDEEKMEDFFLLSKEEFLASYSYLKESEWEATAAKLKGIIKETA